MESILHVSEFNYKLNYMNITYLYRLLQIIRQHFDDNFIIQDKNQSNETV